ncbi:hypothetical protein ACI1US_00170 [Leucobacter sp. BZR 635]
MRTHPRRNPIRRLVLSLGILALVVGALFLPIPITVSGGPACAPEAAAQCEQTTKTQWVPLHQLIWPAD